MPKIKPLLTNTPEPEKQEERTYQTSCWLTKSARRIVKRLIERREDAGVKSNQSMIIIEGIMLLAEREGIEEGK